MNSKDKRKKYDERLSRGENPFDTYVFPYKLISGITPTLLNTDGMVCAISRYGAIK